MIYFIRDPNVGAVKIGYSNNPHRRFENLQMGSPTRLKLVALTDGDRGDEKSLHVRFGAQRLRGGWFREEGALTGYLATLPPAPQKPRVFKTEKAELIARLRVATGARFQTIDGWLERNSIPARYFAAIAAAGIFTLEELATRAASQREAA